MGDKKNKDKQRIHARKFLVIYFILLPILTFLLSHFFSWLQRLLYQQEGEFLYSPDWFILFALMFAFFLPALIYELVIYLKFKDLWRLELEAWGKDKKYYKTFTAGLVVLVLLFSILTLFTFHNYVKVQDNQIIISHFSISENEKIFVPNDLISTSYISSCEYHYKRFFSTSHCLSSHPLLSSLNNQNSQQTSGFCQKEDVPDFKNKLWRINVFQLILFFASVYIAYLIVSGKSPIKKVSHTTKKIIKICFILLPIFYFLLISLPILRDTFFHQLIAVRGYISSQGRMSGPTNTLVPTSIYQEIALNRKTYFLILYPYSVEKGDLVKICYLPHSKMIVDIKTLSKVKDLP